MSSFAELFEESKSQRDLKEGSDLLVQVLDINENYVTVGAALKSEARIPVSEFTDGNNDLEVSVGDTIEVEIELLENGVGATILSRYNARRKSVWRTIEEAMENDGVVEGVIQSRVRGGFSVALSGLRAFLPGSLADVFPASALDETLIGKTQQFRPIKINRRRNSVVLSRRAVIEHNMANGEGGDTLDDIEENERFTGKVRAIVDYGAFVEIREGIFGLLHITDMSWKHTKSISDIMQVGDDIETVVLRVDKERRRVSLGRKQLEPDPWEYFERMYPIGSRIFGTVVKILDYGVFVEIEGPLQGLVHTSEMSWSRRIVHPSKLVNIGDEVEVMLLEIDKQRRRISLGMKQCKNNPWQEFATAYRKGDKLQCKVRSINEFGIFMELPGGIEGLVHMSDISYEEKGGDAIREYHKGDEVEIVILSIEAERERIGLGIKQLSDEKFSGFVGDNLKGTMLTIRVVSLEEKGAVVQVAPDDIRGFLPISEISEMRLENISDHVKEGEEHEAVLIDIDHRNKRAIVSLKVKERKRREEIIQEKKGGKVTTKLGALLQAKLQEFSEENKDQDQDQDESENESENEDKDK